MAIDIANIVGETTDYERKRQLDADKPKSGTHQSYDSLVSKYKFENYAFTKVRSVFHARTGREFTEDDYESWGIVEVSGSLVILLQEGLDFCRRNFKKMWYKTPDGRVELPDYPEDSILEGLVNALAHRSYLEIGSEVHIDMFDNRIEIFSPGGMFENRPVQECDIMSVKSRRRNPVLADIFNL